MKQSTTAGKIIIFFGWGENPTDELQQQLEPLQRKSTELRSLKKLETGEVRRKRN